MIRVERDAIVDPGLDIIPRSISEFGGTPTPPIAVPEYDSSASLLPSAWLSWSRFGAGVRH
jgi:hypothetical protein